MYTMVHGIIKKSFLVRFRNFREFFFLYTAICRYLLNVFALSPNLQGGGAGGSLRLVNYGNLMLMVLVHLNILFQ